MKLAFAVLFALLSTVVPASAIPITLVGFLSPSPDLPFGSSTGTGTALVTLDTQDDTMRVQVAFEGAVGVTTMAHIHVIDGPGDMPGDRRGPVATQRPSLRGFPLGVTSGTYDETFDLASERSYAGTFVFAAGSVWNARIALVTALTNQRAYLNIHTDRFTAGEISGFLLFCGINDAPACPSVPEPGALTLLGLAVAGGVARRLSRG